MMPSYAATRYPWLHGREPQPDIETMTTFQLEDEISICTHFEQHHREMSEGIGVIDPEIHRHQAHLWWQRRHRVTQLLREQARVA